MMRLGIIANIDVIDKIPKGDKINYIKFMVDFFRKKRKVVLIDWRDVDDELDVSRHLVCDKEKISLKKEKSKLSDLCDTLFVKQLGKIHAEKNEFLRFLSNLEKFNGRIINPLKTIRNNLSKQYLLDFQNKGFPVVPTVEIERKTTLSQLKNIQFKNDFYKEYPKDVVIKPKIFGEQGFAVRRLSSFKDEEEFEDYKKQNSPLLAQPLIEEIFEKGENSFIFLGKKLIHAVNKFTGEFKVNCQDGIVCSVHFPTKKEHEISSKIVENFSDSADYMRIDMIPYKDNPLISEVETVNPAFYIENVLSLKENFVRKLEKLFLTLKN